MIAGVLAALALVAGGSAPASAAPGRNAERPAPARGAAECRKCSGTGRVACPDAAKHACPDRLASHCSVAIACERCEGASLVPCASCVQEPDAELAALRAENRAWLAEVRSIDQTLGKALRHADSPRFLLTYDVAELDLKGIETPHEALHLYLARLEELFARFGAELSALPGDFLDRTHVLLWDDVKLQETASLRYTRQSSRTESKLMGKSPVVSIFYDEEWLHEESELHQAVVHQVTHCLLSNVWDGVWPGNIKCGWLDEGLAHAYEIVLFGGARHYCYIESDTILDMKFGVWESEVRAAVDRDEAPSFLKVSALDTIELEPGDQPFAWSYVDFVLREFPGKLGPLARELKARRPLKEALEAVLGLTPFEFEERWKAFVRAKYSLKKKKKA